MAEAVVRPAVEEAADFGRDQGLIHEAVVMGRKVGAGKDFWKTLAHDEALFAKTVAYIARGGVDIVREVIVSIPLTEAEKAAMDLLGVGKVFTQAQAKSKIALPIRYSETALRECAAQNAARESDWRLIYLAGKSHRALETEIGRNRKLKPCFDPDSTWWLQTAEDGWANEGFEAGYYLLDFGPQSQGRFGATAWANQDAEIAKLGPEFERAHEAMVSEAAIRIFQATGERLLQGWYHWGRLLASDGYRVYVGGFDQHGWLVDRYDHPSGAVHVSLRVCLLRKFQS